MIDVFSEGFTKTNEELDKSQKAVTEEELYLVDEVPENASLVNISMRIPGDIKNNRYISRTFDIIINEFMSNYNVLKEVIWDLSTGPQAFIIIQKDAGILKEEAIKFEKEQVLGQLADIDIFAIEGDEPSPITREELGLPARTSISKDENQQSISLAEVRLKISKLIADNVTF